MSGLYFLTSSSNRASQSSDHSEETYVKSLLRGVPDGFMNQLWAGPYSMAYCGSFTSEGIVRPGPRKKLCSTRCEDTPKCRPTALTALASSPLVSRCGPILRTVQSLRPLSYIAKPS